MSKEKARAFLEYLLEHTELAERMKGFTQEHLRMAAEDLTKEGKIQPQEFERNHPY